MNENHRDRVNSCIKIIEAKYGFPKSDILSTQRSKALIKPRFILYAVLHKIGFSYSEIGYSLGKDHTTVIHGVKRALTEWPEEIESINAPLVDLNQLVRLKNPYTLGNSKRWRWLYELYQGKCAICGFSDVIQVHHLVPRSVGGTDDAANLIVLCPNHHALMHLGLVDISKLSRPQPTYPQP